MFPACSLLILIHYDTQILYREVDARVWILQPGVTILKHTVCHP